MKAIQESDLFRLAADWREQGREFVYAVVVQTSGSTPRKAGAKMLIDRGGRIEGTVGGGDVELQIIERARQLMDERGEAELLPFDLSEKAGHACGGQMSVYLEPVLQARQVLVFGAGHVAAALCPLLVQLGYGVTVFDDRQGRLELEAFAECKRITAPYEELETRLRFHDELDIIVMTPEHRFDFEVAQRVCDKPFRSLGIMGSLRKRKQLFERLQQASISEQYLSRITLPVGMDIGSETPQEIAVSVAAELIRQHADPKKIWNNT